MQEDATLKRRRGTFSSLDCVAFTNIYNCASRIRQKRCSDEPPSDYGVAPLSFWEYNRQRGLVDGRTITSPRNEKYDIPPPSPVTLDIQSSTSPQSYYTSSTKGLLFKPPDGWPI